MIFLCIGTDRSTGDSLGPLVGKRLKELGYNVIGTIDDPCHAENLKEHLQTIPPEEYVVAIDDALGQVKSVGKIKEGEGTLSPGAALDKGLPPVGNYHYKGIVNASGFMEYFVLQNTRLSLVMKMAEEIVQRILVKFPLTEQEAACTSVHTQG